MPFNVYPLEANAWGEICIAMLYIASITFGIAVLSLFISLLQKIQEKDYYTKALKIGLIALLISGISLLLTAVSCGLSIVNAYNNLSFLIIL